MVYTRDVTTLLQDGLGKVLSGTTSFNEIYKLIEIDDELDSHYSEEMQYDPNKAKEESIQNEQSVNPNQPAQTTQLAQPTQEQQTKEDELGNTEVLDLGALN